MTCLVEFMKDGPEGDEFHSKLEIIEVGVDDDGDAITSCVVVEAEPAVAKAPGANLTPNRATMLALLDDFGPSGATVEEWNAAARQEGLGKRNASLYDFRKALKDKHLVHTANDRWYVTKL